MATSNRRWIKLTIAVLAFAGFAMIEGCYPSTMEPGHPRRNRVLFNNADYYDVHGNFKPDAAKQAYLDLMVYLHYPVTKYVKEHLTVTDFGLGRFTEVGFASVPAVDRQEYGYAGRDIILLPGQMIPEHWYVKTAKAYPKMETWQLRYGNLYIDSEGPSSPKVRSVVPAIEQPFVTVRHEVVLKPGQVTSLTKPLEKHWQQAGPVGAVATEYSTYHDPAAVRFTDPNIKLEPEPVQQKK